MSEAKAATTVAKSKAQVTYDSVLVHVEAAHLSTRRTEIAARVARAFDARLIGLGAEALEPLPPADPFSGMATGEWVAAVIQQIGEDLKSAEAAFARDAQGVETEWRTVEDQPVRAMARASRAADLIVAGGSKPEFGDAYRRADPAELALTSGRPVLVGPIEAVDLRAKAVVVAWKDTRETRRALADALPFLVRAEDVVVMAVSGQDEVQVAEAETLDVVAALKRRGVPARSVVVSAPDASVAEELNAEAAACGADLIVAGAYGHSRFAEWVLGGATRDLLDNPQRYLLLSH